MLYNKNRPEATTLGDIHTLDDIDRHIYTEDEIKSFSFQNAVNSHLLARKPGPMRSKLAYSEVMKNMKPTTKYLLPGTVVLFGYANPKTAADLPYYDATPMTLFFGITRTEDGNIREVGLNLHYYPPYTRLRVLQKALNTFSQFFIQQFNEDIHRPNRMISWNRLKYLMNQNLKIAFGVKMYIPSLRGRSYVLPTRLLPTAFYTEGHFSNATIPQIQKFWRQF